MRSYNSKNSVVLMVQESRGPTGKGIVGKAGHSKDAKLPWWVEVLFVQI